MIATKTLDYKFSDKHKAYMKKCLSCTVNVAEGAVRAGKTVDNVFVFAFLLETAPDRIHLATGSTIANAKLNIGDCNGLGLEAIFKGRCRWGKYKDNECLKIKTKTGEKVVIFAGGAKADSYKKIRGNSYGMWIATEINLHTDSVIKEAFNRQLAAKGRKVFWDLNPDNPNSFIYKEYLDVYAKKQSSGLFLGGYNYAHFTIKDNLSVKPERIKQIISQYDQTSVWYRRDILGMRCSAEGVVYPKYAQSSEVFRVNLADKNTAEKHLKDAEFADIGVDIGGNRSLTTFVATVFHKSFRAITVIKDHAIKGNKGEIDPERVYAELKQFIALLKAEFPQIKIRAVHPDCAEQYIINGIRKTFENCGIKIPVIESEKPPINDRIRCVNALIGANKIFVSNDCGIVHNGLINAVWDLEAAAKGIDKRADDFTSDIDILDAFEYSFTSYINLLSPEVKKGKKPRISPQITRQDFLGGWD